MPNYYQVEHVSSFDPQGVKVKPSKNIFFHQKFETTLGVTNKEMSLDSNKVKTDMTNPEKTLQSDIF